MPRNLDLEAPSVAEVTMTLSEARELQEVIADAASPGSDDLDSALTDGLTRLATNQTDEAFIVLKLIQDGQDTDTDTGQPQPESAA